MVSSVIFIEGGWALFDRKTAKHLTFDDFFSRHYEPVSKDLRALTNILKRANRSWSFAFSSYFSILLLWHFFFSSTSKGLGKRLLKALSDIVAIVDISTAENKLQGRNFDENSDDDAPLEEDESYGGDEMEEEEGEEINDGANGKLYVLLL